MILKIYTISLVCGVDEMPDGQWRVHAVAASGNDECEFDLLYDTEDEAKAIRKGNFFSIQVA